MQCSGAPSQHQDGSVHARVGYRFVQCEISCLKPGMRGERFCVDAKCDGRGKAAVRKEAMKGQGGEKAGWMNRRITPGRSVLMYSLRDIRLVGVYRINFVRNNPHPALRRVHKI